MVQKPMSIEEMMISQLQGMIEAKKQIEQVNNRVDLIEAKITTRPDYFTVVGYAIMNKWQIGLNIASQVGAKAKRICTSRGITIENIPDPRFGKVGMYPRNVLAEAFEGFAF